MNKRKDIPSPLRKIVADKKSGSSTLLDKLNRFLIKNLKDISELNQHIPYLKRELHSFSGIISYLAELEQQTSLEDVKKYLIKHSGNEEQIYKTIYTKLFPFIKNHTRILTLSNSKTVFKILSLLKKDNKNLRVIIAESRPRLEGRVMAKLLAKEKIKVEIITDAMLPVFIEKCDSVIIGADQILRNGNIVNKTGSRTTAVLCKEYSKPFYVVADKRKKTKANRYTPDKKPASEVWGIKDTHIKIHNFYFEEVEREYIAKVIIN